MANPHLDVCIELLTEEVGESLNLVVCCIAVEESRYRHQTLRGQMLRQQRRVVRRRKKLRSFTPFI
jgi:hypothetical protein